jgi:preprotein translocase subunit SecA
MKKALSGGESIQFGMMTRFIAKAQAKVEHYHFDIRKNLLEYDNVANEQRLVIYKQREELLGRDDVSEIINNMRYDVAEKLFHDHVPAGSMEEQWDLEGLEKALLGDFAISLNLHKLLREDDHLHDGSLKEMVIKSIVYEYQQKTEKLDEKSIRQFEKISLMQALDAHWREHLNAMDHLRNSINLRGYAQKDPKNEYKKESFSLFSSMLDNLKYEVISNLAKMRIQVPEEAQRMEEEWKNSIRNIEAQHEDVLSGSASSSEEEEKAFTAHQPFVRDTAKVKRNDPCPCGSGKKYKQCHGALA